MKLAKYILIFLAAITALVGFGWIIFEAVQFIFGQFGVLDPTLTAVMAVVSITIIFSASILAGAIRSVANSGDKPVHTEKENSYKLFVEHYFAQNSLATDEIATLDRSMALWASDGVLKQYMKLRNIKDQKNQTWQDYPQAQRVLLEIRKDLGHRNLGMTTENMSKILDQKHSKPNTL